jgi:hypothetical protein
MFSFPLKHSDIENSIFQKYILFNSNNKDLINKLEDLML